MQLVEEKNDKLYALQSKELEKLYSPMATKILQALAKQPACPKDIAKNLKIHEQKVYYHIHSLEKQGIIKIIKKEERRGIIAKIYDIASPSFFVKFKELKQVPKVSATVPNFLEPFILNNFMNAKIIVGSPDPHGPERARSRDAYYAIDLALFLGTFLSSSHPVVKLDTEITKDELKENLIIIGGPVVNRITKEINALLPLRFDEKKNIFSSRTRKTYKNDDTGIIVNIRNPFNRDNKILMIAGKRYSGTRAAILAFIRKFDEISKHACVVEGIDNDGDGIIDDVRILE